MTVRLRQTIHDHPRCSRHETILNAVQRIRVGFPGPAASHLVAPASPRDEGNLGQTSIRMRKKSASGVLARHCRLTGSAAFTDVTRFIQRVVNLRGSPYATGQEPVLAGSGWAGTKERFASSFAAALLDGLFAHPAGDSDARRPVCETRRMTQ
ncbi:protein of unknown function [Nitrospira defluvii]|uniref:Uncharacterized protein n=1 Tax=Nitrospira defluvii TaxID=330214 RepID=D8PJ40_9BACT|nr:protein of unknown function [Nitrospira defluvii]